MKKHENIKNKLKIAGFIFLAAGIALSVAAFVNFFKTAFNGGGQPKLFFLFFIGFPLLGLGGAILGFAFQREVINYTKNEGMPVIKEVVKEAVATVNDADKESDSENGRNVAVCECGQVNKSDNNYCSKCGKPLRKTCKFCGEEVEASSKFCPKCGKPIE